MASFYTIFGVLAVSTFQPSLPGSFDIISSLPPEAATEILGLLPAKDLLNAAMVNKKWLRLIKGDRRLRQKIRRHVRKEMKARRAAVIYGQRFQSFQRSMGGFRLANTVNNASYSKYDRASNGRSGTRYVPYDSNYIVWNRKKLTSTVTKGDQPCKVFSKVRL